MEKQISYDSAVHQHQPAFDGRARFAAVIGNALEFYDFTIYSFFAIQIGRTFFPSHSQYASLMLSLATFGAGFVTRPLGAFVLGAYSDRVGRRPVMVLSFAMIGSATVVLALTPSYDSIGIAAPIIVIVARMFQGFSLGGEVGPTTAYLMEAAAPEKRGAAVAWQPASQFIASTTGALVGVVLSKSMDGAALESYGWRIAFLIGAASLPYGLWIRGRLPETVHLVEAEISLAGNDKKPLGMIRDNAGVIAVGLLILASATIVTYIAQYTVTYAQNTLHLSADLAFTVILISNCLSIVGVLSGGWLADRFGRRPAMIWPQLAAVLLIYPVYLWAVETHSAVALLVGFGLLSLISPIAYAAFFVSISESLPKRIRGATFGTMYAIAIAGFGGTAQLVVTWLIHATGSPLAPAWYRLFAAAAGLLGMLLIRETGPVATVAKNSNWRPER